jgi:hypothetical protein
MSCKGGKMTVRTFAIALLLATISNVALGQTIKRIEILEFGIYSLDKEKRLSSQTTASGFRNEVSNEKLITATDTVPAHLGVNFGFRFRIIGKKGTTVTLKKVTLIPQPGIQNPKTGETRVRSELSLEKTIGEKYYSGYGFDSPWEIVPGIWTIEFWDGDRKLAAQSFNVVKQ